MIYVIVPFSRPEFLKNVVKNYKQQVYKDKKLIIVENGKAVGTCKKHNIMPDVLLTSDSHQSYAKNEALNWIKNNGGGWWSTFDDDDYYGPMYLENVMENIHRAEIIGKCDTFIKTISGNIRLFEGLGKEQYVPGVHGGTISARAEDCPYFVNNGKWGEDWKFISDYAAMGARCWATSEFYHMICRHSSNTWQIKDESFVRRMHFATDGKCVIKDFGKENRHNIEVVNRLRLGGFKIIKPTGELELEDCQSYIELMKKAEPLEETAKRLLKK